MVSAAYIEDESRMVIDVITDIELAQVIGDDIICYRSHTNKSLNAMTEKEANTTDGRRSLQKMSCYDSERQCGRDYRT